MVRCTSAVTVTRCVRSMVAVATAVALMAVGASAQEEQQELAPPTGNTAVDLIDGWYPVPDAISQESTAEEVCDFFTIPHFSYHFEDGPPLDVTRLVALIGVYAYPNEACFRPNPLQPQGSIDLSVGVDPYLKDTSDIPPAERYRRIDVAELPLEDQVIFDRIVVNTARGLSYTPVGNRLRWRMDESRTHVSPRSYCVAARATSGVGFTTSRVDAASAGPPVPKRFNAPEPVIDYTCTVDNDRILAR